MLTLGNNTVKHLQLAAQINAHDNSTNFSVFVFTCCIAHTIYLGMILTINTIIFPIKPE